jgi:hypothetical protein
MAERGQQLADRERMAEDLAAWGDKADTFEPPDVLGRREAADFLVRKALAENRLKQRRLLRRQAARMRLTGSTQGAPGSRRALPDSVACRRPRGDRTRRPATRRLVRAGASRRGPPGRKQAEPEPPPKPSDLRDYAAIAAGVALLAREARRYGRRVAA